MIAWPASALLTGNGIALILRVPGTEHGDWWSLRGWYVFAATAALAVLSKYAIRSGDRPLFNPSNVALVATFLILGERFADPQDLWWGPMSPGLALTYALIVVGGVVILRRLGLLVVSGAFVAAFALLVGVLALTGQSMTARWHLGPVEGWEYWSALVLSPEVLIFVFFMITDPRTAARGRTAGVLYGVAVAATSAVLIAFQSTEYATKVALLTGLVLVCATRPLLERIAPTGGADQPGRWWRAAAGHRVGVGALGVLVVALVLVGGSVSSPAVAVADAGERPDLELSDEQRPAVELADAVAEVGGGVDPAAAEQLAAEVVEAVLVADRAVAASDAPLASTVATGPYLDELVARPPTPAPVRTVATAGLDVVRDLDEFQSLPRLEVTLVGTSDGTPWTTTYHLLPTREGVLLEREVAAGG